MSDAKFRKATRTGGREAIEGVIRGRYSLSVGNPETAAPEGWKWTLLRDVARLESGHTPSRRKPEYWDDGDIPWIGIRDATGNHGRTLMDTQQHTTQLGIDDSSARLLPANTVCLSRTASVGYVVVMGVPMATSQDFVNWVCSPELDYRFLKYVLLAEQDTYLSFASGTTHQTIYYPEVKAFHVCLPPIEVQRGIADVLQSIDDLIENNRRRVEVLEELARAIYREWFVNFRFPGHEGATFVDSVLGPIPEGWDARPLFEAADVGFGFAFKSNRFNDEGPFPVIRIRNVPHGTTDTFTDEVADEKYRVNDGDILVGMDGEFYVSQWSGGDAWLNQRVTRIRPLECLGPRYLMQAVEGPIRDWNTKIVGTTVAHLGKKHLQEVQVVVPDAGTRALSDNVLEPTALLIRNLLQQSRRLAELRDLLLPKLVTGLIDVSDLDLDSVVEKAGI